MKVLSTLILAASALVLPVNPAYADTTNSNKGTSTMERKASPKAAKSDEERAEASQGQPDVPHPGGITPRTTKKADPSSATSKKGKKDSSSAGSSAPAAALSAEKEQAFKGYDIDGDGAISKAEAAGHAELMTHFDRADRNRDGKLSRTEYDNLGKPRAKTQARADTSAR
jgi:hypothetical protein